MKDLDARPDSADRAAKLLRNALLVGVSALATVSFSAPAFAQDSPDAAQDAAATAEGTESEEDAIVITGVRASLERAMDIKRESTGVVDAISAEDIGKFPDNNLAESLQRIPGVSVSRVAGEGSEVTVRGFGPTFNLVTVNGRQMATANVNAVGGDQDVDFGRATSRSFDFSNLASEGVSRLEVYKTGRAAIPSGGIGAAINIVTQRPLDAAGDGLRGSIGAKANIDLSRSGIKPTPEISGLVNWSDPSDTFGVSVFGAYERRKSALASATSNSWNITGRDVGRGGNQPFTRIAGPFINANTVINNLPDQEQLIAIPNDSRYHFSEFDRERINGQATLQFRPMDNLTLTADAFYAENKTEEQRSDQTNWFNRPFDEITFDDNPLVATPIFIHETLNPVKDIGFEQQFRATKDKLQDFGLNALWEIADGLTLNLDAHSSKSSSNPNAPNGSSSTLVSFGAPVVAEHSLDMSTGFPIQRYVVNDGAPGTDGIMGTADDRGNNNGVLDIGDLGTQVQRTNASRQKHRVDQIRADLGWELDAGARFDVGFNYIKSKMTSARIQTQQTLGDWGINNVGDVQALAGDLINQYCLACKFDHYPVGDAQIAFRGNAVDLYEAFRAHYEGLGRAVNVSGNDFDRITETIYSGYAQFTWKGDFGGRPANLVAGVRYENTKVDGFARVVSPDRIEWDSDNDFTRVLVFDDPSKIVERSGEAEHNNFLPAVDFQIEPMDDVVARVSYSKTLARPDYGNLFVSESANGPGRPTALGGNATGTTGNIGLKPLVSDNFDVSLEWYYGRSSYVSAGFFAKKVKNFLGTSVVNRGLFDLRDPSSAAPGSRSGIALAALESGFLGITPGLTDVNLFTLTALLVQNNGNLAAAQAQFAANFNNGALSQSFVDTVLAATDVIANANDPFFTFSVTTPINTRKGNIHGFELQGQHFFGDSGFGVSGSFTKVYGDVEFDPGQNPDEETFALVGLSDSFNVTGIFERYGFSARVAYNWRGRYLAAINRGGNNRNPVYVAPFGTLDLSLNYDLTSNIALSLEAVNILSENVHTHGRDKKQLFFAQELKPQILLGARYRF